MGKEAIKFYQRILLEEPRAGNSNIFDCISNIVSREDNDSLCTILGSDAVLFIVRELNPNGALGWTVSRVFSISIVGRNLILTMFMTRFFGRALFTAAKSETSAAAASTSSAKAVYNPLQEFFEADRSPDEEKPVVYGTNLSLLPSF
ncbi:hypothetical protein HHK36_004538 [Tetracentron sinense]|uniref:Uncharacterized protein n=1 Tax=Tetracentron sinense TaxID=13715 RepID=A0A835DTA4_TETSI|nr:hypothetical protein HHK36_004538 [Tetracentron sinense]